MSITSLQSFFSVRKGREILPENLPVDVLISLARELAFLGEGRLDHTDAHQFTICLANLMEQLLSMQPITRLERFKNSRDEMLPGLVKELNLNVRNEIVNRFIEIRSGPIELQDAFDVHFL